MKATELLLVLCVRSSVNGGPRADTAAAMLPAASGLYDAVPELLYDILVFIHNWMCRISLTARKSDSRLQAETVHSSTPP